MAKTKTQFDPSEFLVFLKAKFYPLLDRMSEENFTSAYDEFNDIKDAENAREKASQDEGFESHAAKLAKEADDAAQSQGFKNAAALELATKFAHNNGGFPTFQDLHEFVEKLRKADKTAPEVEKYDTFLTANDILS